MRGRGRVRALVVLVLSAPACSLVVPAQAERVHCSAEGAIGPPACGAGQICATGVCTACIKVDACGDGVDNDCNGTIDDGCGDGGDGAP